MTYQQSIYALARLADCADPDRGDRIGLSYTPEGGEDDPSAGARFLRHVEDGTREVWDRVVADNCTAEIDGDHRAPECAECDGSIGRADGVYVHDDPAHDDHPAEPEPLDCPVHDGEWADAVRDLVHDEIHEIADGAPDVYTATRWREFVDLGAYLEEPEIEGRWPEDLTMAAGYALYQIAERLCRALLAEWAEDLDAEAADR